MDSPPSCSLSAGPLSDLGSSGLGGSISSDSVRAHLAMEVKHLCIFPLILRYNRIDSIFSHVY